MRPHGAADGPTGGSVARAIGKQHRPLPGMIRVGKLGPTRGERQQSPMGGSSRRLSGINCSEPLGVHDWQQRRSSTPMRDTPDTTPKPLDALWQPPAIIWVVLSGECLAAVLALAPGDTGSRLVYFGLASILIQWVSLLSLGMLYLLRHSLGGWRPQR